MGEEYFLKSMTGVLQRFHIYFTAMRHITSGSDGVLWQLVEFRLFTSVGGYCQQILRLVCLFGGAFFVMPIVLPSVARRSVRSLPGMIELDDRKRGM